MTEIQKKRAFFSRRHWKKTKVRIIVIALFALMCSFAMGAEMRRTAPKTAAQLEQELADLKSESGKKLAALANEKSRLEAELEAQKRENSVMRKELLETLGKYSMLAEKLKRYEMSAAAVIETLKPVYSGSGDEDTAESLRTVMQSSVALASATVALCDEVSPLLQQPGVDPVRAAKLGIMIGSLKSQVRNVVRFNTPPASPQGFTSCRILNVDEKLKAVVFSAGYRNGIRAGMILRTADGKARFQVVLLKNFTSAALLMSGDKNSFSIGTEVFATSETSVQ